MRQCRLPPTPLVWCSAVVTAYSRFALSSLCCGYLHCLLPDAGFCDCLQGRIVMFQQALEVFEQLLMRLGLRSSESPAHLGRRYGGDVCGWDSSGVEDGGECLQHRSALADQG